MIRKLFKSQFKSLLLPGSIVAALIILSGIIIGLSSQALEIYYVPSGYSVLTPSMNTAALFVISCVGASVIGIAVASYHFSLKKADVYYQAPFKERTIKNVRIVVGLIYALTATIIAFILLTLIFSIKGAYSKPQSYYIDPDFTYTRPNINFGLLIGEFFFILAMNVCCYFISLFFSMQTSSLPNAIIITIAGLSVLGLGATFIKLIIEHFFIDTVSIDFPNLSFGYISGVTSFISTDFEKQILNLPVTVEDGFDFNKYLPIIGTASLGVGLGALCFLQKETSGELCGKGDNKNAIQKIVHHTFNFILLASISMLSDENGFLIIYMLVALYAASNYFLITVWLNRTFKLKKVDWITMVASFGTTFIFAIIFWVLNITRA